MEAEDRNSMNNKSYENERILVIYPHPDDEAFPLPERSQNILMAVHTLRMLA